MHNSSCNPYVNQRNITIEEIGLAVFASSHFRIFAYALYNNLPPRIIAVCDAHNLTIKARQTGPQKINCGAPRATPRPSIFLSL